MQQRVFRASSLGRSISAALDSLDALRAGLEAVRAELERQRLLPPTERTLQRTIVLLNEAAGADRTVVLATRRLAVELARDGQVPAPVRASVRTLRRWALGRLASSDLHYFYPELDEREGARFVQAFVAAARA
jgi:hypothetical protein